MGGKRCADLADGIRQPFLGALVPEVLDRMRSHGVDPAKVPVVVGGIIPDSDAARLKEAGVAAVYTPKDFDLTRMMGDVARLVGAANGDGR